MSENRLKISNPLRVARILRRICQANLQVIVRAASQTGTGVKGRAASVVMDKKPHVMRISNISDRGIGHLKGAGKIQVEFIMMSTKVVFVSKLISTEDNSIHVAFPQTLVSIERRKNARYTCTEDVGAFLSLSLWRPSLADMAMQPYYDHYRDLSNTIAIADMSLGGVCGVTRFPAVHQVVRNGVIDDNAQLILPLQRPVPVKVEVRWMKKIREQSHPDANTMARQYRFGLEFMNQTDAAETAIRQFLQTLSQAGAI